MKSLIRYSKLAIKVLIAAAGIWSAVRYSAECVSGISNGIAFCINVLVPSLFIFLVLTAFIIKSGVSSVIAFPFGWLMKLMRLPTQSGSAIILSLIGGYPIGAGCARMLYEEGILSDSEAEKTAYIAVAAGPGFLINYIGRAVLFSSHAGNILLLSQITAVFLTGLTVGFTVPCSPPEFRSKSSRTSDNLLTASVRSAADATFGMCATVLLFSALIEVIAAVSDAGTADIISAFLEITTGCSRIGQKAPLYVTAFFIGFGGLSVHFQIFAGLGDLRINKIKFFLFRLTEGIFYAASTYIYLMIFPMTTEVFSSVDAPLYAASFATPIGSGALVIASVCFIGSISNQVRRLRICAE